MRCLSGAFSQKLLTFYDKLTLTYRTKIKFIEKIMIAFHP